MIKDSKFVKQQDGTYIHNVTFAPDFKNEQEYQEYQIELDKNLAMKGKQFLFLTDGHGVTRVINLNDIEPV